MRIGIDASCWVNRRGYGRYTRELVHAMLDVDPSHEYVLFLDAASAKAAHDLPSADRAQLVTIETGASAAQAAAADGSRSVADLWRMRAAVKSWNGKLDVLYFPADYTYFPVSTSAKVVITKHDMIDRRVPNMLFPSWRSRLLWEAKVQLAMRRADLVFTVSETSRRDIVNAFGFGPQRVRVVSDAVDPAFTPTANDARRADVLGRYGIAAKDRFVLYVGGISPHKNLITLVQAYQQWAERDAGRHEVSLVLVGDYASDVFHSSYQSIKAIVDGADMASRIRFAGFVPDAELGDLYSAADVLVLPSLYEGFGLPVLESMACGTPVIASDAGALPEVVGDAGLLFDPHRPDQLADALERVLSDEGLRDDLASRGLRRAATFSWKASALTALAAFREIAR